VDPATTPRVSRAAVAPLMQNQPSDDDCTVDSVTVKALTKDPG
jgi:hypothetical protein